MAADQGDAQWGADPSGVSLVSVTASPGADGVVVGPPCDHEWWFALARADKWAHPQQNEDTELLIDVHDTILRAAHVQHVLRVQEIESYANRLLTEAPPCAVSRRVGAARRPEAGGLMSAPTPMFGTAGHG
jgi:hypothetical protein